MDTGLHEALAAMPDRHWWNYRLPPVLERRFASETDAARNSQIRFFLGVNLALCWMAFPLDFLSVPDVWWLALLLRLCLETPIILLGMRVMRGTPPRWQECLASVVPNTISLMTPLTLFAVSTEFDVSRSALVLSLGIVWISVLTPLRMADALIFAFGTLALGDAIGIAGIVRHHAVVSQPDIFIICHILAVLSVLGRLVAERETRNSFLLGLDLQTRSEELARSNARLREMSNTDPLTGLANRRHFDEALANAWKSAAIANAPVALLMIDVDYFKLFNDTAGHQEGDRCLTVVARTIGEQTRRDSDLAARFGGEEFVLLLPGRDAVAAQAVAERVRTAIVALQVFHPGRVGEGFVSVSIGVASSKPGVSGATPAGLIAASDAALYSAKRNGRDRVMLAPPQVRTSFVS
jgi:diguanylate cyclase (GGDEF)-like protein